MADPGMFSHRLRNPEKNWVCLPLDPNSYPPRQLAQALYVADQLNRGPFVYLEHPDDG